MVAQRARAVEDARAFALGLARAGGWRRSTRCRTAGPCASRTASTSASATRRSSPAAREPVVRRRRRCSAICAHARRRPGRRAASTRSCGSQASSAWPRARGLAHHREGGVLVGLEGLERVGDEEQFHGRSAGRRGAAGGAATVAQTARARRRRHPRTPSRCRAGSRPESVTRKVMSAASRCGSSRSAAARPPPMRAEQRQAGDRDDQLAREGGEHARHGRAEQADDAVEHAARRRRRCSARPGRHAPRGPCRWRR